MKAEKWRNIKRLKHFDHILPAVLLSSRPPVRVLPGRLGKRKHR
jgi:hypothetical protein